MLNPFIKSYKAFLIYLSAWQVIAVIQMLVLRFFLNYDILIAVTDSIVFNEIYLLFALSIWYMANYISFENYSPVTVISNHVGAAIITSGLWLFLSYFILLGLVPDYQAMLENTLPWRFFIGIFYYFIIVSLNYVIIYYTNFQKKALRESQLNTLVKEAELKTLKYQINPHFIFNSLNSISSLTISDPLRAQEMTIKLSSFLRNTLAKNDSQKSTLAEELNCIGLYLDIEKVRFQDRFEYIEHVDEECKNKQLPSMILQPLFENAIKHGVYESIEKVIIKLTCTIHDVYLNITLENNYDQETISPKGEGIGLMNIQNRLKLLYKEENLLTYEKDEKEFLVSLLIPLEEKV